MESANVHQDCDPIVDLAENAVATRYDDLPADNVTFQKRRMLDNLGICIAGSNELQTNLARDLIMDWGGKSESTILVYGGKGPCQNVAFANSVLARTLDFCDGANPGYHPSSTDIPTALAVGEMVGATGQEIITALAVGADVAHRIIAAATYEKSSSHAFYGFDGNIVGVFGAAAIAGKLMKLSAEQMAHALGIALNQAAGTHQSNSDGALVVPMIQGFVTQAGIVAAILAKKGVTGVRNVLLGPYGFYQLYTRGRCEPRILTENLRKEYYGPSYTFFKKYPSCGLSLCLTDAALNLVSEHHFTPDDVEWIDVRISDVGYHIVGNPFSLGEHPDVDAKFSAQYCIANAIARKASRLEHFTEQSVRDPSILSLVEKISVRLDQEMILDQNIIHIRLKDNRNLTSHRQWGKGWPQNPLNADEFEEKFRQCIAFAPTKLPNGRAERIMECIDQLELVQDITELVQLCVVES